MSDARFLTCTCGCELFRIGATGSATEGTVQVVCGDCEEEHGLVFASAVPAPTAAPQPSTAMTQREIARSQGFTGDACDRCHAFAMKRDGKCLTCSACGSTSGGCS